MSNNMLGGDVDGMIGLGGKFTEKGEGFKKDLSDIGQRALDAKADFLTEIGKLSSEAAILDQDMTDAKTKQDDDFGLTNWTGDNYTKMSNALAASNAEITAAQTAIQSFIKEAENVVKTSISTNLDTMNTNVTDAGTAALTTATSFATAVKGQADAIYSVMN